MPDIQEIREAQSELLNELYKQISKSFNYQLQHGITYLAKKGVNVVQMAEAFGLTPARIYQIVDRFDKDGIEVLPKEEKEEVNE
jgi:DNA-binding MarR family transcriptional regulator